MIKKATKVYFAFMLAKAFILSDLKKF